MENPVVVFTSNQRYEVEVLKSKLEEHNIGSHIIDKQDSAYVVFGEIELYVEADELAKAKEIINKKE